VPGYILIIVALMLLLDAAWWRVSLRLTKRRLWRVVTSVFMAGQMAGLVAYFLARWWHVGWHLQLPSAVFGAIILWHFLGLAAVLPILILRGCAWLVRGVGRRVGVETRRPAAGNGLTRREWIGAAAALAPPLFTMGLTGAALVQSGHFRVRRFALQIPELPPALDGMTIAHLSDIHVGRITHGRVLRDMLRVTNDLRADLVLLTGDLINDSLADLDEGIALSKAMEGRFGRWMIEGNHDLLENRGEFERRVKASGVPFLLNETAVAQVRGWPVQLFGLRWAQGGSQQRERVTSAWLRELLKQRQPEAFPILLAHHPHTFDAAAEAGLPLTLSGHTHGGQLMLDDEHGFGPAMFRYWSGLYARGRSQLIVSNGVGNWFPLRINAPAEIIHLTLRRV